VPAGYVPMFPFEHNGYKVGCMHYLQAGGYACRCLELLSGAAAVFAASAACRMP
jgi:hypothetical protein